MNGKCPNCKKVSTESEWSKSDSHFLSYKVGNVYEPYGDETKCPKCGEYVCDDWIDWSEEEVSE